MKYFTNKEYLDDIRILKYLIPRLYKRYRMRTNIILLILALSIGYFTFNSFIGFVTNYEPENEYTEQIDINSESMEVPLDTLSIVIDPTNETSSDKLLSFWLDKLDDYKTNPNLIKAYPNLDVDFITNKLKTYKFNESSENKNARWKCIEDYIVVIMIEQEKFGIPASISMAQLILESESKESKLAIKAKNLFGIKWKKGSKYDYVTMNTDEYRKGNMRNESAKFKKYPSYWESIRDHSLFLNGNRYKRLFKSNDYRDWAKGLKVCGYATDPNYDSILISVIEKHNLNHFDRD